MINKKILFASILGNLLEFYDFTLYGLFAPFFAQNFFPSCDKMGSLCASLATYGAGFLMRPLGAIFFGYIGDRFGRKNALVTSLILMSLPTACIGLLPTYSKIGVLASIILVMCRLIQGFCVGGEVSGAVIFLVEHSPYKNRWINGSYASVSSSIGALLASSIALFVFESYMAEWAWRLPFLLGSLIAGVGIFIRIGLPETPPFLEHSFITKLDKIPLWGVLNTKIRELVYVFLGSILVGSLISTFVVYINIHFNVTLGLDKTSSYIYSSILFLYFILSCIFSGYLTQRYGYRKVMLSGALGIILFIYPIVVGLHDESFLLRNVSLFFLALFSAAYVAPFNTFMVLLFPVNMRYSAVSLAYNVGTCLFGGLMPIACVFVSRFLGELADIVCIYLMIASAIGMYIVYFAEKHVTNVPRPLSKSSICEQSLPL